MIIIQRIIVLLFLFFSLNCVAQQPKKGETFLRFNPLALFEPQAGPVLGAEYFLSPQFSIGLDLGFVFYNPVFDSTTIHPIGYRIKPEIRYYLERDKKQRSRFFLALEGAFLQSSTDIYDELPVRDNTGNIIYTYLGGYKKELTAYGAAVKFGIQMPFTPKSKRFYIEFFGGLGLRVKDYTYTGVPPGASIPEDDFDWGIFNTDEDGVYPTVPLGLKLLWKF